MCVVNGLLKVVGMCWVIRIGGVFGGICFSIMWIVLVLLVDVLMVIIGLFVWVFVLLVCGSIVLVESCGGMLSLCILVCMCGLVFVVVIILV